MDEDRYILGHLPFLQEYLESRDATKAYMKYNDVDPHAASSIASQVLADPRIKKFMKERLDIAIVGLNITADAILKKLWDLSEHVDTPPASKITALVNLGKHIGMFKEHLKIEGNGTPLVIKEIVYINAKVKTDEFNNSISLRTKGISGPSVPGN